MIGIAFARAFRQAWVFVPLVIAFCAFAPSAEADELTPVLMWSTDSGNPLPTIQEAADDCYARMAEQEGPNVTPPRGWTSFGCAPETDSYNRPVFVYHAQWWDDYGRHVDGWGYSYYANGCPSDAAWSDSRRTCIDPVNPADPNAGASDCNDCGNPINTATGNKHQHEVDFVSSDLLRLERTYNSEAMAPSSFVGAHWVSNYSIRIETVNASRVVVWRPDGSGYVFSLSGSTWQPSPGVLTRLYRVVDGSGVFTGWTYVERDASQVENFDTLGRLKSIGRNNGENIQLVYDSNNLPTTVTDQSGRKITLSYNAKNLLSQLKDAGGGIYTYSYDGIGRLLTVTFPGPSQKT